MAKNLVIVESPAKAKTINKYLGKDFKVKASMGHVRDLPKKKLGVDVKKGFEAEYEILPTRKKVLDELKAAAKDADMIYLAADPDREGEAICWHLSESLGVRSKKKFHRVVFNEITKRRSRRPSRTRATSTRRRSTPSRRAASSTAWSATRSAPALGQGAARALAPAACSRWPCKLICDREREIRAFVPEEYWTVAAHLEAAQPPVFTGQPRQEGRQERRDRQRRRRPAPCARDLEAADLPRRRRSQPKERRRNPVPPFITSKLQQEAFKKLRFRVKKTMQVAQRLYEGVELGPDGSVGLITYMRTDSTRISDDALVAVRETHRRDLRRASTCPRSRTSTAARRTRRTRTRPSARPTSERDPESIKQYLSQGRVRALQADLEPLRGLADAARGLRRDDRGHRGRPPTCCARKGSTLKFKGFLAVYEETPGREAARRSRKDGAGRPPERAPTPEEAAGASSPPLHGGRRA